MAHMGTGEIRLQGYMPEVERAPQSPDSGAPVSHEVPSREVLLCPQGCSESQQCGSVCPSASQLPPGTVVLETAVLPQAVAGQGEVGDGKGWETVKDVLPFLVKVHGWGEGGCLWWPGELFMYLLYSDLRFVFSHFSLRANVFLIKYCEGITCSFS